MQRICRSAAFCHEQQERAPQYDVQWQISAFKVYGNSNQNLLANEKDAQLVYDPVYDLEKLGVSKDAVTPEFFISMNESGKNEFSGKNCWFSVTEFVDSGKVIDTF